MEIGHYRDGAFVDDGVRYETNGKCFFLTDGNKTEEVTRSAANARAGSWGMAGN